MDRCSYDQCRDELQEERQSERPLSGNFAEIDKSADRICSRLSQAVVPYLHSSVGDPVSDDGTNNDAESFKDEQGASQVRWCDLRDVDRRSHG